MVPSAPPQSASICTQNGVATSERVAACDRRRKNTPEKKSAPSTTRTSNLLMKSQLQTCKNPGGNSTF